MLEARNKEPFAMESPGSESVTTVTTSVEVDVKITGPGSKDSSVANSSEGLWDLHGADAFQQSSYSAERKLNNIEGLQKYRVERYESEANNAMSDVKNLGSNLSDEDDRQENHSTSKNGQEHQKSVEAERSGQEQVNFRRDSQEVESSLNFQQNNRKVGQIHNQHRSYGYEDQSNLQKSSREQQETVESSVVSETLKTSAIQVAGSEMKKIAASAETKARWAMLLSLAGAGKDEAEDGDGGDNRAQELISSKANPAQFEIPIKPGSSTISNQTSPSSMRPSYTEQQPRHRKVEFDIRERRFARSSKAAVEFAVRRSGSGRRQSSRGNFIECDSSLSRAASVKRYMEKLRGDPHIDETHFAGLQAATEDGMEAGTLGIYRDVHGEGEKIEHSIDRVGRELEHEERQAEEGDLKAEHQLHGDVQRIEDVVNGGKERLGKDFEQQGHELEGTLQREGDCLERDARGIDDAIDITGYEITWGAHRLEENIDRKRHSLDLGLECGAEKIKESSRQEENLISGDAHNFKEGLGLDKQYLNHDVCQLETDVILEEKELEQGVHELAGVLGLGKIEVALGQEEQNLEQNTHKVGGTLGLNYLERAMDNEVSIFSLQILTICYDL